MAETVKIEGLKELAAALRELPKAVAARQLRLPVAHAAADMRDDARRRAPISEESLGPGRPKPGTLRKSIVIKKVMGNAMQAIYIVAVRHGKKFRDIGKRHANLDAYYWRFIEFGTTHAAARPFLRPAFEALKRQAVETIKKGLAEGIEVEAAKLGRARL